MDDIAENIKIVREKIAAAAQRSGRSPNIVRLMAVTKTVSDERLRQAITSGVDIIGENYVQEAKRKVEAMRYRNSLAFYRTPSEQQGEIRGEALRDDPFRGPDQRGEGVGQAGQSGRYQAEGSHGSQCKR